MAGKRKVLSKAAPAQHAFEVFKGLTPEQQFEFLRLCLEDEQPNAVRDHSWDYLNAQIDSVELARIKAGRAPNLELGLLVVRLHEKDGLSFGVIGKRLNPPKKYEAVRKIYERTKARIASEQKADALRFGPSDTRR